MFERPRRGELAVLLHVNFVASLCEEELGEFRELVISAGAEPVALLSTTKRVPEPKYFVGSGKVDELKEAILNHKADLLIVNHALSPAQQRNLEKALECRVLDRIGLILDIFAQRARTFEGKLQVELAQLQHLSTRLVRGWTHLERQKGGIGLRGPGETQLESDRRMIGVRIKTIKKRLEKVEKQRQLSRRARRRADLPTVSLVGYTNAGKSTLFNQLTGADCYVADQLFATLDPTLRKIKINNFGEIILADTVGFIRHLPHDLVNAFHATLEESKESDLLIHVIDAHDLRRDAHIEAVMAVLKEIGADLLPQVQVFNKMDLLAHEGPSIKRDKLDEIKRVFVSAKTGLSIDSLHQAIAEALSEEMIIQTIHLTPAQAKIRAYSYANHFVMDEQLDDDGYYLMTLRLPREQYYKIAAMLAEEQE